MRNIFGNNDTYIKQIESELGVIITDRNGEVRISGEREGVEKLIKELAELSKRGNMIQEQNVSYALELSHENSDDAILEMDTDCICHTVLGKPIKPKTIGQKKYIDAIRDKMIVFGLGPAGTGKTYLAMAIAITAFKNHEVERIILTRPAIEAVRSSDFCQATCRAR